MSTSRCQNYKRIVGTLLLDEEEALLRKAGATTLEDVCAFWDERYPYAKKSGRDIVTAELHRRIKNEESQPATAAPNAAPREVNA